QGSRARAVGADVLVPQLPRQRRGRRAASTTRAGRRARSRPARPVERRVTALAVEALCESCQWRPTAGDPIVWPDGAVYPVCVECRPSAALAAQRGALEVERFDLTYRQAADNTAAAALAIRMQALRRAITTDTTHGPKVPTQQARTRARDVNWPASAPPETGH